MCIRMKFSHRLIAGCVLVGLTLVYLILMYTGNVPALFWSNKKHPGGIREKNPLVFNLWQGKVDMSQCKADLNNPDDVISTLDIAQKADYKTYTNNQYHLPHLPLGDAAYSKHLKPLTVIVVPHSHVDPGWLHTMDQYYNQQVKHILDNMVRKLHLYPDMTFIWAEVVFLSRWWTDQSEVIRQQTLDLVQSGRLEIVLGGWVMPDEASTHYISVIDQLVEGHQWVMDNLHVKPVSSWSIDPFGHSGTMPYLWKKAGMNDMVIQRIHQSTKGALILEKSLEFYWKQYWDKTGSGDILCHVMPYMLYSLHHTCGPDKFACSQFDFRHIDGDPVFQLIRPIDKENIAKKAQTLYEQYRLKSSLYKFKTILVPLGDDFRYDFAQEWDQQYSNYRMLMDYMNSRKDWKINVKFGTVKDFFTRIKTEQIRKSEEFPTISGDFFPYSDQNNAYWTGYYTTRPFDKRFSREVETRLRAAEILNSLAFSYSMHWRVKYEGFSKALVKLQDARRNLGLFLHHDAITGTGKSFVVQDYEEKLHNSFSHGESVMGIASQFLLSKGKLNSDPILQGTMLRDDPATSTMQQVVSPTKEGIRFIMFNPTGQMRSEFVEIIVKSVDIEIKDSKRNVIPFQINPIFSSGTEVNPTSFEIVFLSEIQAFGLETYILYTINKTPKSYWSKITVYNSEELIVAPELKFRQTRPRKRGNIYEFIYIENEQIGAEFKSYNGMLNKMTVKETNTTTNVMLQFKKYTSRGSGAYIFYPNGPADDMMMGTPVIRVIEGPFSTELHAVYSNLYHRVRLYHHPGLQGKNLFVQNALDMNVNNMRDREPIMRISTNIKNQQGSFFTDENGFQMIGRQRHPSDTPQRQNIERNYYPITTMAFIQDQHTRVTLHAGQPHGAASLEKGWLEVMLDRQLLYDDERGLGEGIYDNKLTMTKFVLQVEHSTLLLNEDKFTYPSLQSNLVNEFLQQPIQKMYTPINTDILLMNFSAVKHSLPCDTTIVSLKTLVKSDMKYNGTSLIVHRKGYKCGFPDRGLHCSTPVINVGELFPAVEDKNIRETTLTHLVTKSASVDIKNLQVPPMEIKSYVIDVEPSNERL